ncbi:MAG: pantoate--beta-alanine ligase [Endomicrobium sp.]|jgi:pantoate--beta-alanine ligase|nr:pantoate--beta-alanine ligase [Endomicrobium sp.]
MKIIKKVSELQKIALKHLVNKDEIGLVPTMGALHEGHISLISKSVKNDDITIVSIFVNPIQFGQNEDYLKYPRPLEKDLAICKKNHVNYVFVPSAEEMFPRANRTRVEVKGLQDLLCGRFRINHFSGVDTVVAKLFNITFADRAYFGMKDFQQLRIIEKMVKDLNFRTKIVPCEIVREKSGLALSSRNFYLNPEEKESAVLISKTLKLAKEEIKVKSFSAAVKNAVKRISSIKNSRIDYVEAVDFNDLSPVSKNTKKAVLAVAVWIGKTRLIDNIIISKIVRE